ncbi:MAG: beta-galactosidase [Terracidiphilus sp.]|nr:beta-galactosidase [Terracidiphilus sp.]
MKALLRQLPTFAILSALALAPAALSAQSMPLAPHSFRVQDGSFQLDGKPFRIISGEMHYPRIPRAYWRARLRMAKAMGLNTITTYVFWNVHEPSPGVYDFSGQNDVAEFIREAQSEGLYVILRPGPYVCAEWEFGGYPSWLLKDHSIVVRSADPKFTEPTRRWLLRLGQELAPLQMVNHGPIIAVQVENEYGSFGDDHAYMEQIHHDLLEAGFSMFVLYTADGADELPKGSLPELPAVINFGPGHAKTEFAKLQKQRTQGPYMNGEYWAGWFDHWGEKHHTTDARQQTDELAWILQQGFSISIYMFHGGTSFGWMNGANSNGKNYEPDTTSYDYDAPLDESGRPTPKYFLFRDVIAKATGITPPPVPSVDPPIAIPAVKLAQSTSLWRNLPDRVRTDRLLTMEDLDQAYGYILYRTFDTDKGDFDLVLDGLHDYARIYVNETLVGSLDRRLDQNHLAIHIPAARSRLDILVENTGRVNFTTVLRGERKGITGQVTLAGKPIANWQIYSLPMNTPEKMHFAPGDCTGPCFYRGTLQVANVADTFLDTSNFVKGFVWINGHPLGRIWNIGPQKTLYLPAPWLKPGANDVIVFDLEGASGRTIEGKAAPILNGTSPD